MSDRRTIRDTRIPVTVVTGYLGAGKTTLVNHVLAQAAGRRYAVIVNEFGDIGIDGELIDGGDEELIELNSGCICCVVRGDLIRTLRNLLSRKTDLDGILIETTGLANPGPVIQTFVADQILKAQCRLDSVLVLVDALHIEAQLTAKSDAADQIALADLIILNKATEATARLPAIKSKLRALNPIALIQATDRSRIDTQTLMTNYSFALDKVERHLETLPDHNHGHDHNHISEGGITSRSVRVAEQLDPVQLETWLQELLSVHGADILRTKGIVNIAGETRKLVIQAVHMMLEGDFAGDWATDEPRETRIVFIGRNLDDLPLRKGIIAAIAVPVV